tara:strand:+ start:261 stop:431 length:171 start_codon:yes stop_codon:yes gene_type:complete
MNLCWVVGFTFKIKIAMKKEKLNQVHTQGRAEDRWDDSSKRNQPIKEPGNHRQEEE